MITAERIETIYSALASARSHLAEAAECEHAARYTYENKRLSALAAGQIAGRNESEREAAARQLLAEEYTAVTIAEAAARCARLDYDLAGLQVEQLRAELRLLEATAPAVPTLAAYEPEPITLLGAA